MTAEDAAAAMDLTASTIYRYEAGRTKNIPQERLEKLAELYEVSIAYLLGIDDLEDASPLVLTIDEQFFIEDYRKLNYEDQMTLKVLCRRFLEVENDDAPFVQLTL